MPIGLEPDALRPLAAELREAAARAGAGASEVAVMTRLPLADGERARDLIARYAEAGATRVIHGAQYEDEAEARQVVDRLVRAAGG
jgi:alkanesulfonate monooxygenase SsuD/methylene tetrahydromethanopterin reductase-like flavin-dependent oxidoreductase (luciferase family)